jgi:phosphatidylglycerophosphate synthase
MFDHRLRSTSARVLDPVAARVPGAVSPLLISGVGVAAGLGAALAAAAGMVVVALTAWFVNRLADGLDGAVARRRGRASDIGGYLDIVGDMTVYVAVVLGVAVGVDERSTWIAAAVLLGSFTINTISWAHLAALLEGRGAGAAHNGESTSVTMPAGLVEGAETIVWYTLLLAVPALAPWWMGTMAAATLAGAALRVRAGTARLRDLDADRLEAGGRGTGGRGAADRRDAGRADDAVDADARSVPAEAVRRP